MGPLKWPWSPPAKPPPPRPAEQVPAPRLPPSMEASLEDLQRRSAHFARETRDADQIIAALGLPMDQARVEGCAINVQRVLARIRALMDAKARSVAMTNALEVIRSGCDVSQAGSWLTHDEIGAKADAALKLKTPWAETNKRGTRA